MRTFILCKIIDFHQWLAKILQIQVLGKYLKLVYEAHEKANTLDSMDINADGSLDVFDFWVQCFYLPENVIAAISDFKGQK
jgi:hypothetical protein